MSLKNFVASVAVGAMAFMAVGNAQADVVTFQGGNINDGANWLASDGTTTGFPAAGEEGIVDIDATFPNTASFSAFNAGGDIVFSGGSTLTAVQDLIAGNPDSLTFNNVTVNAGDDIFTGGGNFIFNDGSIASAFDDFEANADGTLTINGGTHTAGDFFGVQGTNNDNASSLIVTGGDITAGQFRIGATGDLSLGGTAVLSGGGNASTLEGSADITSDWVGSWTITGLSDDDWLTEITGGAWTLDGTTVDSSVFATSFLVSDGGQTVSLVTTAVPEPASATLIGLAGICLMVRRRK